MSFIDQAQDPRRRAAGIAGVAAVHAALGIAVVTGLTITGVIAPPDTYDPAIQFPVRPPDPAPKPEPAPTVEQTIPAPPSPLPPIPVPQPSPLIDRVPFDETSVILPDVPLHPGTGANATPERPGPPALKPQRATPSNAQSRWITNDDYPARALRDEAEGTAAYRLVIGSNGRVSACEITSGTGHRMLDDATCRFITARARFEPATDETGARVLGTFTGTVRWQLPD